MSGNEQPLSKVLRQAVMSRQMHEELEARKREEERASWVERSLAHNLNRIREWAEHGAGWVQVAGVNGTPEIDKEDKHYYHPKTPELLERLREVGRKEGFDVLPSPPGVVRGFWCVWDHEAWRARE